VTSLRHRPLALFWALVCHGSFSIAVALMALGLYDGLQHGIGRLSGASAWVANGLLLAQFPLLHSYLLTRRGSRLLELCTASAPKPARATLAPTIFATVAALQILAVFLLWSPTGVVLFELHGAGRGLSSATFAASWIFLLKALADAGLNLQTGSIGWRALWNGNAPRFPDMPTRGLFAACRQPIYLGFALLLWTGPVLSADRLFLAAPWTAYCLLGPRLKETRFGERYGARFRLYQERTPYFLPLGRRARARAVEAG
jgi:protein-S-isoprenylcysteine O-methyltransferase Ste14